MLTSPDVMTGTGSQLSVAVADPVFAGALDASQLIVILAGQVITGAVTSWTVMIWEPEVALPATSVAVKVLVIV